MNNIRNVSRRGFIQAAFVTGTFVLGCAGKTCPSTPVGERLQWFDAGFSTGHLPENRRRWKRHHSCSSL